MASKQNPPTVEFFTITDHLMFASYRAQRNLGMSHEDTLKLGIGSDLFRTVYEMALVIGPVELYL